MDRRQVFAATTVGLFFGASWLTSSAVLAQTQSTVQVPKFQYDPTFPQPLPEKWAIGAIGGMAVDSHDNIWVLHRPGPLQKNERFAGADIQHLDRQRGRVLLADSAQADDHRQGHLGQVKH